MSLPVRRGPVVCAWGVHGGYLHQNETVLELIKEMCRPVCLGQNCDGHPRHPLYVPYSTALLRLR